jgi:uncharacterized protein YjbJ (UPF0337 family)
MPKSSAGVIASGAGEHSFRRLRVNLAGTQSSKQGAKNMNSDQLKGKWKQMKGSVKERWGKLTDDDLDVIDGQSDQLIGKIQERYGVAREEAKKQVDEWNSHVARGSESERQRDVEEKRKAS